LINTFEKNEAEFKRLANWVETDTAVYSNAEFTARIAALGVKHLVRSHEHETYFTMSSNGYAVHGAYKGIVHSAERKEPQCESLDTCDLPLHTMAYRQLGPDWYLYLAND
jgi:hypothetical protein